MKLARGKKLWGGTVLLAAALGSQPAAPAEEAARRRWTPGDFGGVLSVGLEGHRNFQAGVAHYRALCAGCHCLGKHGDGPAPDLTRRALTYSPEELLNHVLSDSNHRDHAPPKPGLIDSLTQAGVLDLLAFVLSGADPKSPFFFNPEGRSLPVHAPAQCTVARPLLADRSRSARPRRERAI